MDPIVVTAQGYDFSTKVDGVLIVEAEFLQTYLGGSEIVVGRVIQKGSTRSNDRTIEYYKTELQAAERFEQEASSPYVLKRIRDRFTWSVTPIPALAHKSAAMAVPVFNDVEGAERRRAQALISSLRDGRF